MATTALGNRISSIVNDGWDVALTCGVMMKDTDNKIILIIVKTTLNSLKFFIIKSLLVNYHVNE